MQQPTPTAAWPQPVRPARQVRLVLDDPAEGKEPPAHDISAAARAGDTLFLAADERAHLEILDLRSEHFTEHRRLDLRRFFDLPDRGDELDIEGLAIDQDWLWIVGSHSLTRKKPKNGKPLDADALERLAGLKDNDNRMFLGRLPLCRMADGRWDIQLKNAGGDRQPRMLPIGKHGSHLHRRLKKDPLIGPFCALAAKENGVDVEGIVVDGARVWLGMRGPVINGWAIVLEQELKVQGSALKLAGPLKKHFLDLNGLGIRDLKRRGSDLLILAGPTMKLDGPTHVFRWRDWMTSSGGGDLLHAPERLLDLPYGHDCDHPEALAPIGHAGADALLVVCDSPGPHRLAGGALLADVFTLPATQADAGG